MLDVKTIELRVEQLMAQYAVDFQILERGQLDVDSYLDHVAQRLVLAVKVRVAAETVDTQFVAYPASWWQHLKQDWAPAWFVRRYPVRKSAVRIDTRAYYPNVSLPDHRHVFRLHRMGTMPRWEEGAEIA